MSFWFWVGFAIVFVLAITFAIASLRMNEPDYTVFGGEWQDEDTWRKF